MRSFITSIEVSGIKNIDQPIRLEFHDKTIRKTFDLKGTNIKAIYGPNGSGKSAIIQALDIYLDLLDNENYLASDDNQSFLDEIIHKVNKTFSISIDFVIYKEKQNNMVYNCYRHEVVFRKDRRGRYYLGQETMSSLPKKGLVDKANAFEILSKEGDLSFSDEQLRPHLFPLLTNRTKYSSICSIIFDVDPEQITEDKSIIDRIYTLFGPYYTLYYNTIAFLEACDDHMRFVRQKSLMGQAFQRNISKVEESATDSNDNPEFDIVILTDSTERIHKSSLESTKTATKNMERFLQLFKPELTSIDLETKEDHDSYVIDRYFNYGEYRIHLEFESTGIKKLVRLYSALCLLEQGRTVFIDEMDANINDVYLSKIIEYFKNYPTGQLVFTLHNVSPMEVLRSNKHAIDFLTYDSKIVSWVKNGNYSVVNQYQSGMIEGLPFNLQDFDFLGKFGTEHE